MVLVRYRDLNKVFGIPYTRVHIRRLELANAFPRSFNIGLGRGGKVWRTSEIEDWLEERMARRDD